MGPERILDPTDARVRDFVALKGGDARAGVLIAESELVVRRLLRGSLRVRSVLLTERRLERMLDALTDLEAPVYVVDREVMAAIAGYDVHRGVLAAAERPTAADLGDLASRARRLLVLEGSNDTENIGAVARSARALGIDGLVLDGSCADPWSRRAVRVSMGEVLDLEIARSDDLVGALDRLHAHGFHTWALTPDPTAEVLYDLVPGDRVALVAGAEGPGLSSGVLAGCHHRVRIPLSHGVDSLNLGHAVAIAVAHVSPARR